MTQQEHGDNLAALRRAAEVDQFTVNEEKSQCNCTEISLLGCQVEGGVIKPDPQRGPSIARLTDACNKKRTTTKNGIICLLCQVDSQLLCNDPTSSANSKAAAQ